MNRVYESIIAGLNEAVKDVKSKKLERKTVMIVSIKKYRADEVKKMVRKSPKLDI